MTFPVVEDIATASGGGTSQSVVFSTIGLTVNSGERLVCLASHDGLPTVTLNTSGFTEHYNAGNSTHNYGMWSKVADGTETQMDFSLSASEDGAYILFTVSGDDGFELSSVVEGSGTDTPNPPSFTPSFGSGDHLWAAVEMNDRARSITTYPTDYSGNQTNQVTGGSSGAACGIAFRSIAAATQDPGVFDLNNNDEWAALTLAFQGTGGGGGLSIPVAQRSYRNMRA